MQTDKKIRGEARRRRTLAIISHPDAGKTTLTEKLLLYGGALDLAGSVTAKKKQRETASDWLELEKKRGISISSTVLQFDYLGYRLNLLDTPGHKDFSEDTYRVLTAVDAVIMVIDAGKGIESQTVKLFEICRKRGIPIFTFMNKLDRPSMEPLELIDRLEDVLGLHAFPVNWPLGDGRFFKGVYDRLKKEVHLFERVPGGSSRAPVSVHSISDPAIGDILQGRAYQDTVEELEILDGAHGGFEPDEVLRGKSTPVFFGSAVNNFGVELLLNGFLEFSSEPAPRKSGGKPVPLDGRDFSAFVFKVQTNMNPMHRDRVVFARVCSGRFCRDMKVPHRRSGRDIRLSYSYNLFGQNRDVVDEAYPGDIIGFATKLDFRAGDTVSTSPAVSFREIPRFAPECFAFIHSTSSATYKSFRKGLEHLLAEDIVQPFTLFESASNTPLLGAVGPLQFEVLEYRLKDEYRADLRLEMTPWKIARWLSPSVRPEDIKNSLPAGAAAAFDDRERLLVLFSEKWSFDYFAEKNPDIKFYDTPPAEE